MLQLLDVHRFSRCNMGELLFCNNFRIIPYFFWNFSHWYSYGQILVELQAILCLKIPFPE